MIPKRYIVVSAFKIQISGHVALNCVGDKIYLFPYIENNSECYDVMVKWKMRVKEILYINFFYKQENYMAMTKTK